MISHQLTYACTGATRTDVSNPILTSYTINFTVSKAQIYVFPRLPYCTELSRVIDADVVH